ncbi:hypothetical protein [uncultured Microbacterium sp.]|uniref:hypothetical protein n=1 Tax=uncultured Microbacterium sp. TaxID=191216 RepID=UPI0025F75ADF|nr:hypothetical protein [uncultured Microbacterium sp.]
MLQKRALAGGKPTDEVLAAGIAYTTAGQRLGLLIPAAANDLDTLIAYTVQASDRPDLRESIARLDSCTSVLVDWYRGTLRYSDVRAQFEERMIRNRALVAAQKDSQTPADVTDV